MMRSRMRQMTPADIERIAELAAEQNERDGTEYPLPQVFVPELSDASLCRQSVHVPLALVTEINGRVEQGHLFLRTLEMMSFGTNRRATAASIRDRAAVFYLLRQKGYQDLHIQVPKVKVANMEHSLAEAMGMARDDDRLVHFYREL